MKTLVTFVLLFCGTLLNAQTLNLRIGDSQAKGCAGVEFKYGNISLSAGWRPMKLLYPDRWYHSFSGALTLFANPGGESLYFTTAAASAGMVYYDKSEYNYEPEPSVIALIGLRYFPHRDIPEFTNRISFDVGTGVNMSTHHTVLAIEFIVNFSLTK